MMKVKYYKCPTCGKKYKTLTGWGEHMNTNHPGSIPEGYSIARYFYFTVTGKTHGVCRTCKKDTPWNDQTMKYDQYCENPECKKAYAKIAKQRMIGKYGKVHLLNDPDIQKKMLSNRKISGKYKFDNGEEFEYVGSYEREFLNMLNKMMEWRSSDLMSPSPHVYHYDYKNPKDDPKNEGDKFYIPDFYIPSLNLEIEIKQQTSTNKEFNDINRVKEKLKDEVLDSNKNVNYLKLNDNDFTPFFKFLMEAKEYMPTPENVRKNQMDLVMESYLEDNSELSVANEGYIFSKDDTIRNLDDFESGKSNILLITGLSRSGKTTLGEDLASKYRATLISLDKFENFTGFADYQCNNLDERGMLNIFFSENAYGKKYYELVTSGANNISEEIISQTMKECVKFVINHCSRYRNSKFIIEGLQIYSDSKYEDIKDYPIIIKGTSMLKSFSRRTTKSFRNFRMYMNEEKKLKQFHSDMNAMVQESLSSYVMEEAIYSPEKKYPVFIVLQHSGTPFANVIRSVTKDEFSHSLISFNSKLDPVYSFGGKTDGSNEFGFVIQNKNVDFYNHFRTRYSVYVMFVDKVGLHKMKKKLKWFLENEDLFKYSVFSTIRAGLRLSSESAEKKKKFFCSYFVAYLLREGKELDMIPSLYKPQDLAELNDITLVNRGRDFSHYNYHKTDKNVELVKAGKFDEIAIESSLLPNDTSTVYFTKEITPESLITIYNTVGGNLEGNVGVKISTGEAGGYNFLNPKLIKGLVNKLNGTIIECNTAYPGKRNTTDAHWETIKDHGFLDIAPCEILDEYGEFEIPVENGLHLSGNLVGVGMKKYNSILMLQHFKGHSMAGFGGALKNMSIGLASSNGKIRIHTSGKGKDFDDLMTADSHSFKESMADADKSIIDYMGSENLLYINVVNNLSVDCDCSDHPEPPKMKDIGIFASTDPVALDQACVDAVYNSNDSGKDALIERMETRNGIHIVESAEKLGLGNRKYNLVNIDDPCFGIDDTTIALSNEIHQTITNERWNIGMNYTLEGFLDYCEDAGIVQEGLMSFVEGMRDKFVDVVASWKKTFRISELSTDPEVKNLAASNTASTVVVTPRGMIEIRGINYTTLKQRITEYYGDKSIFNMFLPKYYPQSYKRFLKKKISRGQIRIQYVYVPRFFALELTTLFSDLGIRYNDKVYKAIAVKIYNDSWLSEADKKAEQTASLNTKNLENLKYTLKPYQQDFIERYPKLKAQLNMNGYILAFEQGLGKTLTATALAECLDVDHVYIVCPNSLKENWALELKNYYKKYEDDDVWKSEVFRCVGSNKVLFNPDTTRFIITNIESIKKMYPYVLGGKNMLIIDESHNFRNIQSKRVTELLELRDKLKCTDVLAMSGTPIKATPSELSPILAMIDPTFTKRAADLFDHAFKLKQVMGISLVQTRFGKVMYRKDKEILGDTLPAKIIDNLYVNISNQDKYLLENVTKVVMDRFSEIYNKEKKDALSLKDEFFAISRKYRENDEEFKRFKSCVEITVSEKDWLHELDKVFVEEYMKKALAKMKKPDEKKRYDYLIKTYVRFKMHCLGLAFGEILPVYRRNMFSDMYDENATEIIKMINNSTKKTIIFSQFKPVVDHICDDLNERNIGALKITGEVKNRMEILQEFKNNDAIRVLVATSQTIGTGVTLIEASQMFFFGPPWRDADFAQCSDRIHRIGQTDDVRIYTVVLDTGEAPNLSTRMSSILNWSKEMTEAAIITTDDKEDYENNFEDILTASESYNQIVTEGLFNRSQHITHRLDEFEDGTSNILLVTGLSGSGKTIISEKLSKKCNAEYIELDIFEHNAGFTDDQLQEAGECFYEYFTKTTPGMQFRRLSKDNKVTPGILENNIKIFSKWLLRWCMTKRNKKWIIEGVQIYSCFDFEDVKRFPIVIMNTGVTKSITRRIKRSGYEGNFFELYNYYSDENKLLKDFKKDIKSSVYESLTDKELFDDFIMKEPDDKFNVYKEIPEKYLKDLFTYETGFHMCRAVALEDIPKDCILEKMSVQSPLGSDGTFHTMQFTKLGSAVFSEPVSDKKGAVRFEYVNDNGFEYWNLITNRNIKKGEIISYNPNEGASFTDESRL